MSFEEAMRLVLTGAVTRESTSQTGGEP
jgi:hypothetical protein